MIARTDARASEGLEGAIRRARAYVEAGAGAVHGWSDRGGAEAAAHPGRLAGAGEADGARAHDQHTFHADADGTSIDEVAQARPVGALRIEDERGHWVELELLPAPAMGRGGPTRDAG